MNSSYQLTAENLTHGYALAGNADALRSELFNFFENDLKIVLSGNPDFFHEKFETLTIEDARRIKTIHGEKSFSSDKPRIFLIEICGATIEAQNALLKVFEEPQPGNHFFLIVSSLDFLLPTLKSRLHLIRHDESVFGKTPDKIGIEKINDTKKFSVDIFTKGSLKERIAFVDALAAAVSDEKAAKHDAVAFLNSLERSLYENSQYEKNSKKIGFSENNIAAFEAIARARTYLNDRAPSVKTLLEYVTLSL